MIQPTPGPWWHDRVALAIRYRLPENSPDHYGEGDDGTRSIVDLRGSLSGINTEDDVRLLTASRGLFDFVVDQAMKGNADAQAALIRLELGEVSRTAAQYPTAGNPLMKDIPWNRTSEILPTVEPGAQEDVIFCSPDWGWPILGLYTHLPPDSDVGCWSMYDQVNDRFVEWGNPDPELWIYRPNIPELEQPAPSPL